MIHNFENTESVGRHGWQHIKMLGSCYPEFVHIQNTKFVSNFILLTAKT